MCLIYAQIFPTVVAESAISVKQSKLPPGIAPPEKIIRGPQGHQFYNCHILRPSCIVTGPHQSMKLMIDDNGSIDIGYQWTIDRASFCDY